MITTRSFDGEDLTGRYGSMNVEIEQWILTWFESRNPGVPIEPDVDFYSARLIDSFGIIELIDEAEEHFSLQFLDSDFQKPEFRTVSGMARTIKARMQ